jgi:hypothetical protein
MPVKLPDRDEADSTIAGCLVRGLKEELIKDYDGSVRISTHAFIMETKVLNFASVSLVEIPDLDFKSLVKLWRSATDVKEHDALAALPLDPDILRECLESPTIPTTVRSNLSKHGFTGLTDADHSWHTSGYVRLALLLWQTTL